MSLHKRVQQAVAIAAIGAAAFYSSEASGLSKEGSGTLTINPIIPFPTVPNPCGAPVFETVKLHSAGGSSPAQKLNIEANWLPHVLEAQAPAANVEALKAIAVADRSLVYFSIQQKGFISDGGFLKYEGSPTPSANVLEAVESTERQVMTSFSPYGIYGSNLTAGYAVPGATPSLMGSAPLGMAEAGDPDPTGTEHDVTYNSQRVSVAIHASPLGPRSSNWNRGALSLAGADFLADHGFNYQQILHYYYGEDTRLTFGDLRYKTTYAGLKSITSPAMLAELNPDIPAARQITLSGFESDEGYLNADFAARAENRDVLFDAATSANRSTRTAHTGRWSQRIAVDYDESAGKSFRLREFSGIGIAQLMGTSSTNMVLPERGHIGFWLNTKTHGLRAALTLHDEVGSLGTSTDAKIIADGQWHQYDWDVSAISFPAYTPAQTIFSSGTYDVRHEVSLQSLAFSGNSDAVMYLDDLYYQPAGSDTGKTHVASVEAPALGSLAPEPIEISVFAFACTAIARRRR